MNLAIPDWNGANTKILGNTAGSASGEQGLVSVILGRDPMRQEEKFVRMSDWGYVIHSGLLDDYWLPRPHAHSLALGSVFISFDASWSPVGWKSQDQFLRTIYSALEADLLESGIRHPVEETVRNALRSDRRSREWIRAAVLENFKDSFAADLLRCVGRIEYGLIGKWGIELAEAALASRSVEIRDASLQALESWGRPSLDALRAHLGCEQTDWLRAYTAQVIQDLQA